MKVKILLVYKDTETDSYEIESVWAEKEGKHYKIDNIPFFAKNIALGDIIKAEEDSGALYFDRLIKASGNSTIRMLVFNESMLVDIIKTLEELGLYWEGSHIKNLIAVNIPKSVDYKKVKKVLDQGEHDGIWEYEEACLGFK